MRLTGTSAPSWRVSVARPSPRTAWAIAARQLGWAGYAEVAVFIGVLLLSLWYLWLKGGLQWGTASRQ